MIADSSEGPPGNVSISPTREEKYIRRLTELKRPFDLAAKGVEVNPRILAGKPVIKGTRIPVYLILDLIAAGYTFQRIVEAYPVLTANDIKAAVEYAASILKSREAADYQVA